MPEPGPGAAASPPQPADQFQARVRDLTALLALPNIWSGAEPQRIVENLLDVLRVMLYADLVYAALPATDQRAALEAARVGGRLEAADDLAVLAQGLQAWQAAGQPGTAWTFPNGRPSQPVRLMQTALEGGGARGLVIVGAARADFPNEFEQFLFRVAANQATLSLQTAYHLIALRESELRYRSLATATSSLIWVTDRHGAFVVEQPAWQAYTGQAWPDHAGWGWADALHPDDRARIWAEWARVLADEVIYETEGRLWHAASGTHRHFVARAVPIRHADGRVREWVGTVTDVHDQKQLEAAHRQLAEAAVAIAKAQSLEAVLQVTTDQARAVIGAHQSVTSHIVEFNWPEAFNVVSLSDKYAAFRGYATPPDGSGIYVLPCRTNQPMRLTSAELEAHPAWRGFGREAGRHPPMVGWLAVPLVGHDGRNLGLIQVSDKYQGEFTDVDEAILVQLAQLGSSAIENMRLVEAEQRARAGLEQRVRERTAELEHSHQQLRDLSARLHATRELERTQIAREIHDEFGQQLTGLKMDLVRLGKQLSPGDSARRATVEELTQSVDDMIKTVRRIATDLRPSILDDFGLLAAIEWQLQEFRARSGIESRLTAEVDEALIDREQGTALFRIFQETLTNVARHAQATRVEVDLQRQHRHLVLRITDNGRGISPSQLSGTQSLGLLGIRERVRLLSGEISIVGEPGQGTTVLVKVPLRSGEPGRAA